MIRIKKGISASHNTEDSFLFKISENNPFESAFILTDDFAFTEEYLIEKEEEEYVF